MGYDDLVDYRVVRNCARKRLRPTLIEKDGSAVTDISRSTIRSLYLLVNGFLLPTCPRHTNVLSGILKNLTLAIEKDEYMIVEYRDEVAQFLAVILSWVRPTPQLQECLLAQCGEELFSRGASSRLPDPHKRAPGAALRDIVLSTAVMSVTMA